MNDDEKGWVSHRYGNEFDYREGRGHEWDRSWNRPSQEPVFNYGDETSGYGFHGRFAGRSGWHQEYQFGRYRGVGPKGYLRSDEALEDELCRRLWIHPAIDASDVAVEVKEGCVTLSGTVASKEMKDLVEDEAEAVHGIREIGNRLGVSADSRRGDRGEPGRSLPGTVRVGPPRTLPGTR